MIISIFNRKGGSGKTSLTLELAFLFGEGKQKSKKKHKNCSVLVIDADPQATTTIDMSGTSDHDIGLYDVLSKKAGPGDAIIKVDAWGDQVFLLPSDDRLGNLTTDLRRGTSYPEKTFKIVLEKAMSRFDYVFIDCPPDIYLNSSMALASSDYFVTPMLLGKYGYQGLCESLDHAKEIKELFNPSLVFLGVVVTASDKMHLKDNIERLGEIEKDHVLLGAARNAVEVERSKSRGEPVSKKQTLAVTSDYVAIAKNIERRASNDVSKSTN